MKTLAWMAIGLLLTEKISLSAWVPVVHSRVVYAQSTARRFVRWLDNERINVSALYGALMVTILTVICAAAQFLAAPVLGKLGDRYGRRPVLSVSLLGATIGYAILGIGGTLWVLFLVRLIGGIIVGNLSTVSAYLADVSDFPIRAGWRSPPSAFDLKH